MTGTPLHVANFVSFPDAFTGVEPTLQAVKGCARRYEGGRTT